MSQNVLGKIMLCLPLFLQAEDGIRDGTVTGVQTCALPICACIIGLNPADDSGWAGGPDVIPQTILGAPSSVLEGGAFDFLRSLRPGRVGHSKQNGMISELRQ